MQLRTEITSRLGTTLDWAALIDDLEKEADALADAEEKSVRLQSIAHLAEEVIPERERALGIYQKAWKIFPANIAALSRARHVYDEMGRPDMVAKVGEMELKAIVLPRAKGELALLVGQRYLDSGQKEKGEKALELAVQLLPESAAAKDALAAATYNPEDWLDEVERLRAEAEQTEPVRAARLCLRAARILRAEMPDDPSIEQTLRRALALDPMNSEAGYLLGLVLAKNTRWDELTANQDSRGDALDDTAARALLYRRFAMEWLQRFKDKERAAVFFEKALAVAFTNGADELPSQVAAFSILRETWGARREWGKVLALVDQALGARLAEERKHLAALTGGVIAWKELDDPERARPYFERIRAVAPDSPILRDFDLAHPLAAVPEGAEGAEGAVRVIDPVPEPVAAPEPQPEPKQSKKAAAAAAKEAAAREATAAKEAAANQAIAAKELAAREQAAKEASRREAAAPPPRVEVDTGPETISDAQRGLMEVAAGLEASGATPDKALDAWKKAVLSDPTRRAPRRRLAELLRRIERWNALVEALKEEEAKACSTPDDKVAVLLEMVEIYRDRLRLDVMVAGTLTQILNHQPANLEVLDQLMAQYEAMKRWPDLVGTLKKKVVAVTEPHDKVHLHLQVANLYIEKFSNQAEAIKSFEAALELDPDNVEAAGHLKQVYEKRRDWEKLIALEKREIARGGDGGERLRRSVDLAKLASDKLKKPAVSIELWAAVTAIDPDHLEALGELEKLYEREKQWDKLSDVSERQAELAPDAARKVAALQKLGILYTEKVSDPERAVVAWRRLLEAEPENRRGQDALKKLYVAQKSWADLEKFYAGQGKLDEFARVLERQVELEDDATKATMSNRLAALYRDQLGKPQSAVKWLERVLSLDAQNLEAAEALIPLYEASKDPKKLAGVLEIQLAQTRDPLEKKARLQRLAALVEQSLRDKLTAYVWWLRAFDADPDDDAVRAEVERLAGETGGWPALVNAYEGAYGRMASPLPLMSVVARVQEAQLADVERAIGTNKQILAADDVNEDALDALERLYLGGQRYEELLSILAKKLELTLDPEKRRQLQLKVGQLYEDELKDDAKAISAYRAILDDGPAPETERDVLAALDRMYERKSAWTELADVIVRELSLVGPEHPEPHVGLKFRLGQVRERHLDDALGAIDAYRDILDLQPAHEGARRSLEKRLPEAPHQLQAAAILEPIYQKLEAWKDLVGVHEIQLAREESKDQRVELLLRIGELHGQKLGDGPAAFDAAARGFREDPARPEARANLDELAQIVDDGWPRVVALFEEALKPGKVEDLDPALVHELSRKAAAAYQDRLDRSDLAVEHYQRALTIEPEDADALEALDRIFTREEKYTELLEVYKKKVDLARDPEVRLALLHRIASIWEEMLANHEQAIATYKEILGQEHEDVRALRALDRLYLHQGHWQDLADNLVRQLAINVDGGAEGGDARGEQVVLLGRLAALREQKLGEAASAIDTYRQVLELAPEHPGAIEALERLLVDRTRDPNAEHELTIATILEPVYQASGAWQKQIGVYDIMARHAFDPARKIELLHQIGELYELGEDADRGFESYARAFREDPAGLETQRRLDRLARVHGKWPQIVRLIDEVATGVGDDELKITLLTRLAQIHELELGQDEEAVKTHARILEVDPRHLAAASAIEAIHERTSDYARLVTALKRKAEIVDDVDAKKGLLYKAAQIEEEILEQPDEAIATYRVVLNVDDIDGFSMDALERLYSKLGRWGALKDVYAKKAELAQAPDEKKRMLFVLGQVHDRELGDVPKAIETYQAILDLDPGDLGAIQALDRLYGQAGRWYDLLQILEREVELSETTGTTVALKHRIGELWEKELHDLVRAIESYREVLDLDGTHAPTLKALDGLVHAKDGGEPVLAAQVLEPIYERAAEFDRLVDLLEVMVKHAEDPLRKVELYHRIAELHERRLERADAAFEAFGRALREDSGNEVTLANLERLADQTRAYATLAALYEQELGQEATAAGTRKEPLDPHRQVDLLLRLARAYEEELALADRAIATFRRVLDVDSENRAAIAALDRLYEAGLAWPELAEILRKEIRLAGSDEEVIAISFRLGQLYEHALKDLPQAVEVYRDVLGQDPAHAPTLSALELMFLEGSLQVEIGNIVEPLYRAGGEWEKLHKIYEVQLEKLTDVTERQGMYQRLAELAEQKLAAEGGLQRAFRWWGLATLEDPRNERAYEELERLAGELSNWEELVSVYGEGLNRHVAGDVQKALLLRTARVYDAELRDAQRAETSYMRVLAVDPAEATALASLDRIYETSGMFNELAEILIRRVVVTDSTEDLVDLHFRLGRIQSDVLGDLDLAIASYDKILGEDSRNRTALECLERIYFRREEWQKLYDVYEKLVDVAKGDEELAEVYARMARLSSDALGDDDRASDLWGRVIDLRGEDPIGLAALGEIYERRELWREMVDVLERQVRIATAPADQVTIYKRLGRVWNDKLGRERNALEAWVHAFEVDPTDLETLRHLAVLYRATQSWEELSDTLRRILEVGQMNADVSEQELVELYAQLGQLEGEVLGRTNDAVEAWRRVLALDPANEPALSALEALFTREGRWEDGIEVLEKRAQVAADDRSRLDTLLQAGAIWEDKVGDKSRAALVYERVRATEPGNTIASAQLEAIYREQYDWSRLTEVLLERVEHTEAAPDRISILAGVAKIYEEEVNDQESAFVVLQAAFKEDYAYEPVARDLERLATGAGKWEELLADYTQVVQGLERTEPGKAADLWVKIGRWYADHMSHVDYAIHSVQAALKLDPKHLGALSAMADFQRKRGSWGELIETLGKHAAIEPDAQKRVELYLGLGELLETQLMDPMQAMTAYRAALEADPVQPDALRALDRLYRGAEMFEQLIDVLGRKAEASTDPEEQARLRLEIGRHWDERLNEPAAAIDAFRTVLTVDPQNLAAMRSLERLYERTGQAEAYLDVLEQQLDASASDQEKVSLYVRMAAAWEERFGKLDRSADCHEKILIIDERNPSAFRELERLYDQEKRWDSLVDTYRRHILAATDPATRIDLYCAMGRIYEDELRDFDRAIEAYSDVLTFDPNEARSLDALGRLYEKIEEWDRAIDTTSRLVEVTADPRLRVDLLHRIGRIQDERLGDPASAEERFLAALSVDTGHAPSMQSLTGLYKKRGDWQKAATMMVRAEQHTSHPLEKVRLFSEAATIFRERMHDDARAMEYYAGALALDPEHVESGEPLAELLFREHKWAELEPVLDMLVRKAPQLKRDSRWLNDLYFRQARTADELQHNEKALKFYKAAYDLDSTHLPTLLGRANLLFKMMDWDAAGKIYQTILVQHRDAQKEGDVVDIYYRLGQVRLRLNERKKALNMFEKALELDPNHRDTLLAVIDLQAQQGDWEAVIHAKRSLLVKSDVDEKFKVLNEVGDTYHQKLTNQQKAIAAYNEALELKPKNHSTLQKVLDLYSETKQWKKAIEVMQQFAELEANPLRKGKYFYAAGVIARDEVKSQDDAVTFFNLALDAYFSDPDKVLAQDLQGYLKPFESIDKIHTSKKDWKSLERSYRQMIKRMPQRPGDGLLVMLWHNLGEIYRSRLKDLKAAAQAYEVAATLDPGNKQRHEILAELYMASGPEFAEKAIAEHMLMLKTEPFRIESYKALRKIYMDAHQYDKAWCVCNTLSFLKKADPEEQQFYEQYKPKGFVRAKQRITDDIWKRVLHPETDRYVSAIFSAIWQGAALVHAQPHKTFGLKRKDKRQIETDQLLFSKVFFYASQVLNVPLPEVYLQPEQPGEILLANAEEKGQLLPSFVVRGNLLQGRPEKELAFVSAKQLTYLRPEHYLKMALPTNAAMKTAFMSALLVVNPKFPVKPDMVPLVQQYLPHLQAKLSQHPQWMEQLHHVVKRFLQAGQDVDLVRWGNAVEATGHRVGFILCGDLEVAARMVSMEPVQVGGPQAKDKIKELVLYSISEDYFAVRHHLGTVIG